MPDDLASLRSHIGDTITDYDVAAPAPIKLLATTLDRTKTEAGTEKGAEIPTGWHGVYFLPNFTEAELGADGAPKTNGVIPAMPFPRRMFAGTRLEFHEPIRIGDELRRETELTDLNIKEGSTGRLGFATVTSRIYGPKGLCVVDERGSAFREEVPAGAESKAPRREPPPSDTVWEATVHPNEMTLFRYSALTFNTHRIHYDHPWATKVEGYPALVVHGPLSQTYLMNFARDNNPGRRMASFAMRARAPLFIDAPVRLVGKPTGPDACDVWAVTPAGTVAVSANVTFA